MPVPYQDPIKNIIDGMLTAYDLSHRIKFQKLQEEAYARQQAQQEREASIKDILTQRDLMGAGRPISGGAVSVPTSTPYAYNLAVPSPLNYDVLPRTGTNPYANELFIDKTGNGPNVVGMESRLPDVSMRGAGTITENILRKADPSRSVKYKTLGGNEMNVELLTPEEQQQRQTQAELNKAWAEAQNRETIQERMRIFPVPDAVAEAFPALRGQRLTRDEMVSLTDKAGALKKQGQVTLAPGAQLIQDGTPVVTNPQPARPVTGELALLQDFTKDWLAAKGLQPTPANNLLARDAYNKSKQTPADAAADFIRIENDPASTPEQKQTARKMREDLQRYQIAIRPQTNVYANIPGLGNMNQAPELTGEAFLKTLPPATAAQVRAIAEGRDTMPSAASRQQAAIQLRNAVYKFDPTFSVQRAQIRKAFMGGPDGRNIGNINTAIVHLGRLGDAAESMGNGSFRPGNELYNYFRDRFGSPTVTNFALLKDAVAGEMAAALKGNATDVEIEKMGKSIRDSNSPQQMAGVISEGMTILNDKANTYNERYHALAPDDPWSPILPSARSQLQQHGIGGQAAPPVGTVQDGYRFKGGDPRVQSNWEKVQ